MSCWLSVFGRVTALGPKLLSHIDVATLIMMHCHTILTIIMVYRILEYTPRPLAATIPCPPARENAMGIGEGGFLSGVLSRASVLYRIALLISLCWKGYVIVIWCGKEEGVSNYH